MVGCPKHKCLRVKRARTRLLDAYRSVALVVGPIHKLYYSIPVIVLSAICLAKGDIDPASKTFTELGITRNLYPRILFYLAALRMIGGLLRATWKAIPKLNQQADKVQVVSLANLGVRHYIVASILGPAAFTFVWVEAFHGHRIVAVAVALAFVINAALANYALLRWNQVLGAQRDIAKLLWRYPVFLTIGALAISTNVFTISTSVGLTASLFLIPNSVEVLMIIRKSLVAVPDGQQQPGNGSAPRNPSQVRSQGAPKPPWVRRWLKDVFSPAVLVVGVIAIVVGIITVRDADKQAESGRELMWRTVLKEDAVLPGAYLPHLDLVGLYIPGADLSGANLSSDNLASSTMTDARFDGADLSKSNLKDARLDNATLSGGNLDEANMQHASLTGADLRGASFRSTDLSRADMFEADLRGTDLSTTNLRDVYLSFLCWDSGTKWPRTARPSEPYCPPPNARKAPRAEQWKIDSFVALGAPLKSWAPVSAVNDTDAQPVTLIIRFHNEGRVVLNSVALAVRLNSQSGDATWIPTKVLLVNGNYPTGYEFPPSSIIESGKTVSVDIGNYAGGAVAYLEVTLMPRHTEHQACGTVTLGSDTYATPSGQGSVEAKTATDFRITQQCR